MNFLDRSIVLAPPELCATTVRTLTIDAVERANSGHPGGPMGLAMVGWQLFARHLRVSPSNPEWPGRDRFVLSNGHSSMLLYALLHLSGYDLSIEDLRAFRQCGSATPGHPERHHTPGVEVTTGPLGQGVGNAVGMAIAERMLAAEFNRPGHEIVDHRTWFMCSDGDLMEGITQEAASLAGFLALERLIGIYDDNEVSLDGPTSLSFGDDTGARFQALGWRVLEVADAEDPAALDAAYAQAATAAGRPTLIIVRTHIGYGSPNKQDRSSAHGSPLGAEEAAATKAGYGWDHEPFYVPPEVDAWREELTARGVAAEAAWGERLEAYARAFPDLAADLTRRMAGEFPDGWDADLPAADPQGAPVATRKASGTAINAIAARMPELIQGAADLSSSTGTTIEGGGDVGPGSYAGRNLRYGVREHAMGAITNGIAAHGGLRPVCSTFLTFSDYMRNTLRLAAIMKLGSVFVYTHDSIGLGEDGPTHQPIEHLAGLRAIPGLVTIRPADAAETTAAWRVAIERIDGPTALIFSRQSLPPLGGAADVARGAYVVADGDQCILIGTGSEVQVALAARDLLAADGISCRVVSMPSWELFGAQPATYRDAVLPPDIRRRVAVEAAAPLGWHRWVGLDGAVVALDRFGASAPGEVVMRELGITPEAVAAAARGRASPV